MKSQFDLRGLAAEIMDRQERKEDFLAPSVDMEMLDSGHVIVKAERGVATLPNEVAHGQIAEKLGIPKRYYDKMRGEAPDLLAQNVNRWLQESEATRMVRTLAPKDGPAYEMRALLSDRYHRIENEDVAEVVLPILHQRQDMRIVSCAITDTRMHIKAIFAEVEAEVKVGDVVRSGVSISNSETGHGRFVIQPLVERLVCQNGMVVNDAGFARSHVGRQLESIEYSEQTKLLQDQTILSEIRDHMMAAIDHDQFEALVDRMRSTTERKLVGSVEKSVKVLGQKKGLLQNEQDSVLRHLIEGGDLSQWGLLNAVTRTAQDVESYDRSHELEAMGSDILDLKPSEWRQIAEAA